MFITKKSQRMICSTVEHIKILFNGECIKNLQANRLAE